MYFDPARYQGDMANHEKMYFFSRDIIRVKNPTETDFRFKYDSVWTTVKAGQTKDMERYLAIKFCTDLAEQIIGQMIEERGRVASEQYQKNNPQAILDKYVENRMVWDKMPRQDDFALNEQIWKDLWVGVVEKYGEDRDIAQPSNQQVKIGESLQEKLIDRFRNVFVGEGNSQTPALSQDEAAYTPQSPSVSSSTAPDTTTVSDRSLESEVTNG